MPRSWGNVELGAGEICRGVLRGILIIKKICCLRHPGLIFVQNKKAL
jgi:hypothetical protein